MSVLSGSHQIKNTSGTGRLPWSRIFRQVGGKRVVVEVLFEVRPVALGLQFQPAADDDPAVPCERAGSACTRALSKSVQLRRSLKPRRALAGSEMAILAPFQAR
jgi:hypothetical protein